MTITVCHKSEYYLLRGQYYRNETWIYFRVVIVLLVYQYIFTVLRK